MYNEGNTYNEFKNIILNLQNIKIKLLKNGIFFTKESINELISFFPIQKYKIELQNLDNNIILIIVPLESFNIVQLYEDINNLIFQYIYSKINYLRTILTINELQYLSCINNIKMLYSFENFSSSLIIRI